MINPTAFVPVPIASRDVHIQTDGTPGARRKRVVRAVVVLLLLVGTTILVELLRWGINQLIAGASTADQEGGTTTTMTITTTIVTTITSTASPDLDEKVRLFIEDLRRRQNLG